MPIRIFNSQRGNTFNLSRTYNSYAECSVEIYDEFQKIKENIEYLYFIEEMSTTDLMEYFNYNGPNSNFNKILDSIGIDKRNIPYSLSLAHKHGKIEPNFTKNQYFTGNHNTWDGRTIHYRSSYELNYAKYLDSLKIYYFVEYLKFEYWDSTDKKYRLSIPDFYLPDYNLIVEIKALYRLDIQNIKDRYNAYSNFGYNFQLICDGKDLTYLIK